MPFLHRKSIFVEGMLKEFVDLPVFKCALRGSCAVLSNALLRDPHLFKMHAKHQTKLRPFRLRPFQLNFIGTSNSTKSMFVYNSWGRFKLKKAIFVYSSRGRFKRESSMPCFGVGCKSALDELLGAGCYHGRRWMSYNGVAVCFWVDKLACPP